MVKTTQGLHNHSMDQVSSLWMLKYELFDLPPERHAEQTVLDKGRQSRLRRGRDAS